MSVENIDILSEKEKRYDEIFLSMLQNEGKIQPFIDQVFRFLYRRTDFYLIQEKADQSYGFPVGVSEKIIKEAFQRYDRYPKEKLKQKIETSNDHVPKSNEASKTKKSEEQKKLDEIEKKCKEPSNDSVKEKLKKQQEIFQKNPASYNGAIRDVYLWTQTIKDIDIQVNLEPRIKSSKDVKIKIQKEQLQVLVKDNNGILTELINDKLPWKIKPDESTWSLFPGDHIHIYLEKTAERWWEKLLISEEKIDLSNTNPEKPMEDLDQESQSKIKQMMFDEHQKKLGQPTSEQNKTNEILRKAWDCEGSPFKGQPFDPSLVMASKDNFFPPK